MATQNSTLTQDHVKSLFDYKDGNLYWKISIGSAKVGKLAGCQGKKGYWQIRLNSKTYKAHRLIFLYFNNYFPDFIDHIDGNRANNNIENLRPATHKENSYNRKIVSKNTPVKGVVWKKQRNRWEVSCWKDNKKYYGGYFVDKFDAIKMAIELRKTHHKEFARHF